jgi:hypothetical protein
MALWRLGPANLFDRTHPTGECPHCQEPPRYVAPLARPTPTPALPALRLPNRFQPFLSHPPTANPPGHYVLDVANPAHEQVLRRLVDLALAAPDMPNFWCAGDWGVLRAGGCQVDMPGWSSRHSFHAEVRGWCAVMCWIVSDLRAARELAARLAC